MAYIERELWIEREDPRDTTGLVRLFGVLRVPEGASGPLPAVILSHGFTADHSECDPYAKVLTEAGFVTVAIDFFGGGANVRSDGKLIDMTVETEAADLLSFVDAVAALPEVDENDIALLGCSQGGFVSTMVASRIPNRIRALVLMYPAFVLHDDALRLYPDAAQIPDSYCAFDGLEFSRISRAYSLVARRCDPYDFMGNYGGPVLIVHGDADPIVPITYSERALRTFDDAQMIVIEGAGHGYKGADLEDATRLARSFLVENK